MADWLGSLKDIISFVTESKAFLEIGASTLAVVSVAGAMPRVGVVRAFTLGWRSYYKTSCPLSIRKSEVKMLDNLTLWMEKGSYIVVTGGNGNGKICLVDTALNHHHGVVKISVNVGFRIIFFI
jgi:hypothetical protein